MTAAEGARAAGHVLVVRLDSLGDVVVCGPAIRAVAGRARRVTVLAGPRGADAARLLPGVDAVEVFRAPWIVADPPALDPTAVAELVERLRALHLDEAVVLTSFHQSALPTALLLRLAGVPRIAAVSEDYPGSLLDVRIPEPADAPEPVRMATVAAAAGYPLPPGDPAFPVLGALPAAPVDLVPDPPYVVVHPGAEAPSRALPDPLAADVVAALHATGTAVVVTGVAGETERNRAVAAGLATDLSGRLDVAQLAAVLAGAAAVVCGNTGPGHLAAAAATPVVSLFAPVVPAVRWAPHGRAVRVLGDQQAACRGTRARECPVAGHPCVSAVTAADVLSALAELGVPGGTPVGRTVDDGVDRALVVAR